MIDTLKKHTEIIDPVCEKKFKGHPAKSKESGTRR
jgi:hypothetical protein